MSALTTDVCTQTRRFPGPVRAPRQPRGDVYDWCMTRTRTNIEIENDYVETIMDRYGVRTKTDAVDLALRHLAGIPMSREEALEMRGAHAIGSVPDDQVPVDVA